MQVAARIFKGQTPVPHLLSLAFFANDGQDSNTVLVTMFHRLWWVYSMAKVIMQTLEDVNKMTYFSIANRAGTTLSSVVSFTCRVVLACVPVCACVHSSYLCNFAGKPRPGTREMDYKPGFAPTTVVKWYSPPPPPLYTLNSLLHTPPPNTT